MSATKVSISTGGGGWLDADLNPANSEDLQGLGGRPCVVMGHGFSATRDCGLSGFITTLNATGADVLAFDYRHFGESSGTPRQLVHPRRQIGDYHAAVQQARTLPGVDPDRIVVWGVSLSGGHVLQVGAEDPRIAAVMSLTPGVDGLAAVGLMLRSRGLRDPSRLLRLTAADAVAATLKRRPVLAPVVGNPGESAAITSPGSLDQMLAIAGRGWRNEFAARGLLHVGAYRPGRLAGRITRPVLMQIADHDTVAPPDAAQRVADKITATVHRYSCDHFEVYTGMPFHDRIAADQAAFLRRIFTSSQHREEAP